MKATDISECTTAVQNSNLVLPKHEVSHSVIPLNCVCTVQRRNKASVQTLAIPAANHTVVGTVIFRGL
jgi:hypothetical protein